jgi:hypothetical protein
MVPIPVGEVILDAPVVPGDNAVEVAVLFNA